MNDPGVADGSVLGGGEEGGKKARLDSEVVSKHPGEVCTVLLVVKQCKKNRSLGFKLNKTEN